MFCNIHREFFMNSEHWARKLFSVSVMWYFCDRNVYYQWSQLYVTQQRCMVDVLLFGFIEGIYT